MSSSDSDDYFSSSDDEPVAQPISPPRGKTLRPPEEDDAVPSQIVRPPPRGKELRLILATNDSDDEPLLSKKGKAKKKTPRKQTVKKKASPRKPAKKRKDPPPPPDSDSEQEAVAAVVVDEDVPVAEPVKRRKLNSSKSKKKSPTSPPLIQLASLEQISAASNARTNLRSQISVLPHALDEYYIVRCLGRIRESDGYSSPHALYPVGFSCDRYEFSPVHGRVVKIRCDILDGRGIHKSAFDGMDESLWTDGPLFRIMWGEGIEADVDTETFPFHPADTASSSVETPTVGTRVAVTFDQSQVYEGSITKAAVNSKKSSGYRTVWNVTILYDDGVVENTFYPDSDIVLFPPGEFDGCV